MSTIISKTFTTVLEGKSTFALKSVYKQTVLIYYDGPVKKKKKYQYSQQSPLKAY